MEKAEVVGLGGLHVVGTERHESRRIDNQLRGRSGRQGDPGSTRCAGLGQVLFAALFEATANTDVSHANVPSDTCLGDKHQIAVHVTRMQLPF